jgi:predicted metal-dependent hydrolase
VPQEHRKKILFEATKRPLKKRKIKIYDVESEDENCGILYEEREDENLEEYFDELNENHSEQLDRFPEADDFFLIRFQINKNKNLLFIW